LGRRLLLHCAVHSVLHGRPLHLHRGQPGDRGVPAACPWALPPAGTARLSRPTTRQFELGPGQLCTSRVPRLRYTPLSCTPFNSS
jgi:hypothetical protein